MLVLRNWMVSNILYTNNLSSTILCKKKSVNLIFHTSLNILSYDRSGSILSFTVCNNMVFWLSYLPSYKGTEGQASFTRVSQQFVNVAINPYICSFSGSLFMDISFRVQKKVHEVYMHSSHLVRPSTLSLPI